MSRVDYVRCDMCGREFAPDAPMGYFMGARWIEGTEAFDLCAGCSERVQRFIMHANDTDGSAEELTGLDEAGD